MCVCLQPHDRHAPTCTANKNHKQVSKKKLPKTHWPTLVFFIIPVSSESIGDKPLLSSGKQHVLKHVSDELSTQGVWNASRNLRPNNWRGTLGSSTPCHKSNAPFDVLSDELSNGTSSFGGQLSTACSRKPCTARNPIQVGARKSHKKLGGRQGKPAPFRPIHQPRQLSTSSGKAWADGAFFFHGDESRF